ncbi:hypothetical protein BB561_006564 [Smittium simulii]|uniref:Mitochondrial dicarboxylate transporter n=1 Tax=Smittium simulii TaxID=133385 RepID=A0A2T9Y349_9FUNG|nr:hypothetical protein BB561_006564 [Smittium simulii]
MSQGSKQTISTPFYFGGVASCSAAVFTHPMDLLKVRLQTNIGSKASIGKVVSEIFRVQGVSGFYRGLSAALLRQASYSTVRFGIYEKLRGKMKRSDGSVSHLASMVSGIVGGAVGGVFGNPADVANVRMQNDGSLPANQKRNYKNIFDALTRMAREEGYKSFFVGLGPNVTRGMVVTMSQVAFYDIFKSTLVGYGMSPENISTHLSSSLLAALLTTTVTNPIDIAKTRIMNSKGREYTGMINTIVSMVKNEGSLSLFKGWAPSLLRLGPHTILVFVFLEQYKSLYIKYFSASKQQI